MVKDMLLNQAVNQGSAGHAKIFLDRFGPTKTDKESRFDVIFNLSDDDLAEIRHKIYQHVHESEAVVSPAPAYSF